MEDEDEDGNDDQAAPDPEQAAAESGRGATESPDREGSAAGQSWPRDIGPPYCWAVSRLMLVALVVVAACGGQPSPDSSTSTTSSMTPAEAEAALQSFLGAIVAGTGVPVVDDRQVVLLAGAEGASTAEIAELFNSVGAGRVAANFWRGFAEGTSLDQVTVDDLRFGRTESFTAGGRDRVSIEVWDAGRQRMRLWQLARIEGEWQLDLFATFGDVYAGPLRLLIRSLDPAAEGFVEVTDALKAQRASLDLAPNTAARLEVSSELAELP